ncbi:MAG TPA: type II toxin-antitoxin system VapC family toxin [Microlunatus sp.]
MIVVDTTVLVYAVGDRHDLRQPCQQLFAAIERGDIAATTTAEVIQEFAHVRAKRRSRSDAVHLAKAYATVFAPLMVVEAVDLEIGLGIFERHTEFGSFDAVLAATAESIGATALVSADSGFSRLSNVTHVIPNREGIDALLDTGTSTQRSDD